jgi:beta-glucanase (GH16 family)
VNGKKCRDECKIRGSETVATCWVTEILPFKYTTGMLFSTENFHRGYFEIRFRLPESPDPPNTHEGFGPNFWLWGNNPPEVYTSEIDVFEIFVLNGAKADTNKYTSTVHFSDMNVKKRPQAHTQAIGNRLKNDTAWHTAAAWWTEEFVKFYLDDSLYFTVQNIPEIKVDKLVDMHLIIDINSPNWGQCNNFTDATLFPYVYEIDYVRVYQKQ